MRHGAVAAFVVPLSNDDFVFLLSEGFGAVDIRHDDCAEKEGRGYFSSCIKIDSMLT